MITSTTTEPGKQCMEAVEKNLSTINMFIPINNSGGHTQSFGHNIESTD